MRLRLTILHHTRATHSTQRVLHPSARPGRCERHAEPYAVRLEPPLGAQMSEERVEQKDLALALKERLEAEHVVRMVLGGKSLAHHMTLGIDLQNTVHKLEFGGLKKWGGIRIFFWRINFH